MSQVTISGAISGLDTASLISQLVSVQGNSQTLLKNQQSAISSRATAYSSLASSLTSLGTLAADLAKTSAWAGSAATSSSSSVTATVTGTTSASITFDVTAVAKAHSLISATSWASSTSDHVASGPLTLTKRDGTTASIDVGSGSLSDVVAGINAAGEGISAAAVRSGAGAYRLQVISTTTGAASDFELSGFDSGFDLAALTKGADAELTFGSAETIKYTVTSSSNTFTDLVPGLSFTVGKVEEGVTVSARVDGSSVADKVSKLVDSANIILSDIAAKTAYDATKKTGGVFSGQSTVRALQQNVLDIVSTAGAPGTEVTRDGKLTFDRDAFLEAFAADSSAVAKAFGATSSFTAPSGATASGVSMTNALKTARAGTYAIDITAAPRRESWQLNPAGGTVAAGSTMILTRGSTTVSYTADDAQTLDAAAAAFNAKSAAAGFGVTAKVSGPSLIFTADSAGVASAFTATLNGTAGTQLTAGRDVAGTIDSQEATGLGSLLSLTAGTGGAVGLSLSVSTTDADVTATSGAIGSLTYTPGLAQRLATLVADATADTGSVGTAQASANAEIKRYQEQIDAWDDRLTAYRKSLTAQFTAMETTLAKLKSATSALTSMVNAYSSSSPSSSSSSS